MQLRDFFFHSSIYNLTFPLLYKSTLLGKWLQTFRQTVRVLIAKDKKSKTISHFADTTKFFCRNVLETISK